MLLLRKRRPERRVEPAPHQGVGGVEEREQDPRHDGRREEVRHRDLEHRPEDHQHDGRRDQDAEGPPGGDRPRGEAHVVARAVHGPRGHDAEDGDRGADDAGRRREDGRYEEHRDVERAAGRGEHELDGPEQPLHEARLLHHDAHEDEEGHRGEGLLQHHAVELEGHQVEDEVAEPPVAEREPEEDEGERDREADEDRGQHDRDHERADQLGAHYGQRLARTA